MATTIGDLKSIIAGYFVDAQGANTPVATYTNINGQDFLLLALNNARRSAERLHDFQYSMENISLSIANVGSDVLDSVKRVSDVMLPVAGGDYMPIELITNDEWNSRVTRAVGTQPYDATRSLTDYGLANINPVAYQQGRTISLAPAVQFTFPVAARLNVVKFLDDYTDDADTDFFTAFAPDYLQWAGIMELNKYAKTFVPRVEGTLPEASVQTFMATAYAALLEWDGAQLSGSSTPVQPNFSTAGPVAAQDQSSSGQ